MIIMASDDAVRAILVERLLLVVIMMVLLTRIILTGAAIAQRWLLLVPKAISLLLPYATSKTQ